MDCKQPPVNLSAAQTEGHQRERLAAYFLSAPPYKEQTPTEREIYRRHQQQLGTLEDREVLQASGSARPLVWGNPVPLLQSLLTAAQRLAATMGQPLLLFPAKETAIDFHTLLHPRLLSLGTVALLRTACLAAPKQPVWVRIQEQRRCLAVSVRATVPFENAHAFSVTKESARLHNGSLALSEHAAGFSIGRAEMPPDDVRPYYSPTAEELLRDTLSSVWTGFYCWLSPSSDEARCASDDSKSSNEKSNPISEG
ncbi:MAG: hypothetical protein II363_04485 [Clostridia bacterium]|nr:hypothetical protein [Clostridia bacterium]